MTVLLSLTIPFFASCKDNKKTLKIGDKAPVFSLTDQNGNVWNMGDYIGKKWVVLFFYPKDESAVCTKEACAFRDDWHQFTEMNAVVAGINNGSVAEHKNFAGNHKLPYSLLSDAGDVVYNQFGIKKKFFINGRATFVIDPEGKIAYSYVALTEGKEHVDNALNFLKTHSIKK